MWGMLFFTCIKLVARVLACAHAIAHIKWKRLKLYKYNKIMTFSMLQCKSEVHGFSNSQTQM